MIARSNDYLSIKIAEILMKIVGFWYVKTVKEQRMMNLLLAFTLCAICVAIIIESVEFYHALADFYEATYVLCSVLPVMLILIKLTFLLLNRQEVIDLIRFTMENFWFVEHNDYDRKVMDEINRGSLILMCLFTFFVQGTVTCYMISPIAESYGKNETDRVLPFKITTNLVPITETPYYEVTFVLETFALVYSGICFCCFDNFFSLINLHTAGQFKILQHKIENIYDHAKAVDTCDLLKPCILDHYKLLRYVNRVENIFTYTILFQLLISSIMICMTGFQIAFGHGIFLRRLIFCAHACGSFFQLFAISITSHEVMVESRKVGDAAYRSYWYREYHRLSKDTRHGLMMVMLRSNRPCHITAGRFSPVTRESFMAAISTAASYFTLLRKFDNDQNS